MSRQVRRVAAAMFLLFAALFVNLNYLQVIRAESLTSDTRNRRQLLREYDIQRGSIIAGTGGQAQELATSVDTEDRLRYLRVYPDGPLWAHATGFYSFIFGRSQLEQSFNEFLVGSSPDTFARNIGDLLDGRERRGDDLLTTLRPAVQAAARDALGDRRGAVVALDPRTGDILAEWSNPTYDPNRLSSHDGPEVRAGWDELQADPANPLLNRVTSQLYPPGSTFKLVTAAAALEDGIGAEQTFDDPRTADLPQTSADIGNFGGGLCNGGNPITLRRALEVSCNTTFAQLGLDLGAEALIDQAEAFGLNREWESQFPYEPSRIPKELDPPQTAQSAIGQRDVRVTPLQMAMIVAAIANDGVLMTPRLVREVQDYEGRVIRQYPVAPLVLPGSAGPQAMAPENAALLTEMMVGVVERGTGGGAAVPGVAVAGKTGTAQTGGDNPTVWFVGFAPAEDPQVAVAVVVEDGGEVGSEATGGRLAAPIAQAVLQAALHPGG